MMIYLLIAILIGLDQFFKFLISQNLHYHEVQPVIHDFFSLTYYHNTGGAFSFLAERNWGIFLLAGISVIASVVLIYFIVRLRNRDVFWIRFSLAILASGTIGNMIDRVRTGAVIDFMMFTFGSYTFPIFNLADSCIVVGSFLLALFMLMDKNLFQTNQAKNDGHSSLPLIVEEGKNPSNDV